LLIDLNQHSWTALPMSSRKFELVAPDEIRRAILIVVEESYGIMPAEISSAFAGSSALLA
jgi:hypothetical protein